MSPTSALRQKTSRLIVPDLVDRPFMGAGCCVLPAAEAIEEELEGWPDVVAAIASDETGIVTVTTATSNFDLRPLLETLELLGYPAQVDPSDAAKGGEDT